MQYKVQKEGEFRYIKEGKRQELIMQDGFFGALNKFADIKPSFNDHSHFINRVLAKKTT